MLKRKAAFILSCVFLVVLAAGILVVFCDMQSADKSTGFTIEGCVILKKRENLFIYVDSDTQRNAVWVINTTDVDLISHDASITAAEDLQPGMMIQLLAHDETINAIFPTPLRDIEYLETWGEYDEKLLEAGLSIYDGTFP